jgi:hypothetical protein
MHRLESFIFFANYVGLLVEYLETINKKTGSRSTYQRERLFLDIERGYITFFHNAIDLLPEWMT